MHYTKLDEPTSEPPRGCCRRLLCALGSVLLGAALVASAVAARRAYIELGDDQRGRARYAGLMASIPIVALFFTWFHIWLAIQMLFWPVHFVGIWQQGDTGIGIGWQGVVPRKAKKMASCAFAKARSHLDSPKVWFARVNPAEMVELIKPHLEGFIDRSFREILPKHFPEMFRILPEGVREEIKLLSLEKAAERSPDVWHDFAEILSATTGLDNDGWIVSLFMRERTLLNRFFQQLGRRELKFIEHCGAVFGFVCGLMQVVAFQSLSTRGRTMFLPVSGFLLGIFSNWLAIFVCFWPIWPHKLRCCGMHLCTVQGLFLRRQWEAAAVYSKMLCDHIFNFNYIVSYLQTQPVLWEELKDTWMCHNIKIMRDVLGTVMVQLAPLALGTEEFDGFQNDLTMKMVEEAGRDEVFQQIFSSYMHDATKVEAANTEAMRRMSPEQFEDLLHPVFKEDEWILVLLGGILGAMVGILQVEFLPV